MSMLSTLALILACFSLCLFCRIFIRDWWWRNAPLGDLRSYLLCIDEFNEYPTAFHMWLLSIHPDEWDETQARMSHETLETQFKRLVEWMREQRRRQTGRDYLLGLGG